MAEELALKIEFKWLGVNQPKIQNAVLPTKRTPQHFGFWVYIFFIWVKYKGELWNFVLKLSLVLHLNEKGYINDHLLIISRVQTIGDRDNR